MVKSAEMSEFKHCYFYLASHAHRQYFSIGRYFRSFHCFDDSNIFLERGSSVVELRTRNQVSPGSNPPLLPFRRVSIFVLSTDAPVDSAV